MGKNFYGGHSMTNRERFERATELHKKHKAERDKPRNQFGVQSLETIPGLALREGQDMIARIIGAPFIHPEENGKTVCIRDSHDPKPISVSRILGDDDKSFHCYFPDPRLKESRDWLLNRVMWYVLKRDRIPDASGRRPFLYEKSHPEIFNRVYKNNKSPKDRFYTMEKGWKSSQLVLMNVIDRQDPEFHKKEKVTKLLCKSDFTVNIEGEDKLLYNYGVPEASLFEKMLLEKLVASYGPWDEYDIAFRKLSELPFYEAFHGEAHKVEITESSRQYIVSGPLTEEEKAYVPKNLDTIFNVTTYSTLKYKLGVFIEEIDRAFNTHFFEELGELVNEEQKKKEKSIGSSAAIIKEKEIPVKEPVAARRTAAPATQENTIPWEKLMNGTYEGRIYVGVYKGIKDLTEEEKSMIIGIDEDGALKYAETDFNGKPTKIMGYRDPETDMEFRSPSCFHRCPYFGVVFDSL